jgi:hypothetical protein
MGDPPRQLHAVGDDNREPPRLATVRGDGNLYVAPKLWNAEGLRP